MTNTSAAGAGDSAADTAPITYLDGLRFERALRAGIRRVLAERDEINRINVFPVADGDTGTNLALTMGSIAAALRQQPSRSIGRLLIRVADAALDGARGNSGAILAQFFQGLADCLGQRDRIDCRELAAALAVANQYAHDALDRPLEGTVLTVVGDVAAEAQRLASDGVGDLGRVMTALQARARESLEKTRTGLEAMRKADVVDAGAKGFVLLLDGMAEFVAHGSLRAVPDPGDVLPPEEALELPPEIEAADIEYRFCTECMVTGSGIDRRKLREALSELGNSMVIAGTRNKLKLHIHTNEPERVFEIAARHGSVSATKADDMRQQSRTVHRTTRVVIVCDSAADLPDAIYEELGIHFVPLRVNFGDRSFMDKVSLTPSEFFARAARSPAPPRTSQPAPGDYRRMFEFLASHFEQVIAISLSGALSGTWQAAVSAAERVRGGRVVTVVDSRSISVGQGLIAMRAAECARAGLTGEALLAEIRRAVEETVCVGLIPDLTAAVRGGRIPGWLQWLAEHLGIAPLFQIDRHGRLVPRGVARAGGDLTAALARFLRRRLPAAERYRVAIGHAADPESAIRLARLLRDSLPGVEPPTIVELSAALGAHGGAGTLAVAAQPWRAPPPHGTVASDQPAD